MPLEIGCIYGQFTPAYCFTKIIKSFMKSSHTNYLILILQVRRRLNNIAKLPPTRIVLMASVRSCQTLGPLLTEGKIPISRDEHVKRGKIFDICRPCENQNTCHPIKNLSDDVLTILPNCLFLRFHFFVNRYCCLPLVTTV